MSENRLLLVGLDSFDYRLAEPWIANGELPHLASFQSEAITRPVTYPPGVESGTVWPSFFRGKDPSHHGQYDGIRFFNPQTYEVETWPADALEQDCLWDNLTRAGKRSIFIDPPYMHLPTDHNGLFLIDWCAHFSHHGEGDLEPASLPASFSDHVLEKYGADPLGGRSCDNISPITAQQHADFRDALVRRTKIKTKLVKDLMAEEAWDAFSVTYCEAHCVAHQSLHLSCRDHPDYDAHMAAKIGDPVKDVYIALDQALGALMGAVPEGTRVFLYLSHGVDLPYTGTGLLDRILQRLEGKPEPGVDTLARGLRSTWRNLPSPVKTLLNSVRHRLATALRQDRSARDREERRYFEIPCHNKTGGIRLNLKGREAKGIVDPADYDSVCRKITDCLDRLTNQETGEPLVEKIQLAKDLYDGPRLDNLPDILVTWNNQKPINRVSSPDLGSFAHVKPTARTGEHYFEGLLMSRSADRTARRHNQAVDVTSLAAEISAHVDTSHPHQPAA
ncbi:MAG: alkaline phosphatase family protein [Alphaproteobacteria bacterium]